MKGNLKAAIFAIVLLIAVAFPALAEITPSKAALVQMISEQPESTNVKHNDIVRMVEAAFSEGKKQNIDPFLIISLMDTESKFHSSARSSEGARGLMQVIPRWHRDKIRGRNINHIETNIEVGTQVLADCLDRQNGNIKKALNCYSSNARNYVAKLKAGYLQARTADMLYRFKHDLPLAVMGKFEDPKNFTILHQPTSTLALNKRRVNEQLILPSRGS
jgi:soluble lytic murein transglycosylase-like protein